MSSHFWIPRRLGTSILAIAKVAEVNGNPESRVDFARVPSLSRILVEVDGTALVVLQAGRSCLTVHLGGASVLDGPIDVTFLIEGREGVRQAPRLMRLAKHLLNARMPIGDPEPRRLQEYQRLRNALIALDGYQVKISQRDIAAVLFGRDLAEAAWREGNLSFKQRTRRAILLGRQLSAGGYRRLLR